MLNCANPQLRICSKSAKSSNSQMCNCSTVQTGCTWSIHRDRFHFEFRVLGFVWLSTTTKHYTTPPQPCDMHECRMVKCIRTIQVHKCQLHKCQLHKCTGTNRCSNYNNCVKVGWKVYPCYNTIPTNSFQIQPGIDLLTLETFSMQTKQMHKLLLKCTIQMLLKYTKCC